MLLIASFSNPSPLMQAAVYMGGILAGYLLLSQPAEWLDVRRAVRDVWTRGRRG